jgi:hypothetical protein
MLGAPDQYGDAAKFQADDLQRATKRDQLPASDRGGPLVPVRSGTVACCPRQTLACGPYVAKCV